MNVCKSGVLCLCIMRDMSVCICVSVCMSASVCVRVCLCVLYVNVCVV